MMNQDEQPGLSPIADLVAVGAAMAFPLVTTWVYFVLLSGADSMRTVYGLSKVVQFALPVAWVLLIQRRPLILTPPRWGDLAVGLMVGGLVVAIGLAAYLAYFKSSPWLAGAPALIEAKLNDMRLAAPAAAGTPGLPSPARYLSFALFLSLPHSLLEEYYWRWFVFSQLKRFVALKAAIMLSSLAFMAHHVIVVDRFLDAPWPATATFSLAVAIGGAIWAGIYHRTGRLYAPWISHLLVDAAIMWIGYDLVWRR